MASSNSAYSTGYTNYFRLYMYSWIVSQDIANNTSLVRSQVFVESLNASFTYTSTHNQSINGVAVLDNYVTSRSISPYSSVLVMDNSLVVPHNADGTKTVAIGATFYNPVTTTLSVTTGFVLDTIPRTSVPTFNSHFTINAAGTSSGTITTNRASTSFTHDITYTFGSASGTIGTGVGASISWAPPTSLLNQITNGVSGGPGKITTVTKSGSTVIGTNQQDFYIDVASDVIPNASSLVWTDENTTVATQIGAYVQNASSISGTVTSSGVFGSTIVSENFTIGSSTVGEGVAVPITGTSVNAYVTVQDTRGRTRTINSDITAKAYSVPSIATNSTVKRANSSGVVDLVAGTYLLLDMEAVCSSLVVSTEKNYMSIAVKTRPTGGAWTDRQTISTAGSTPLIYTTPVLITGGSIAALLNSYEVQVTVTDRVGKVVVKTFEVPTATVTLDLYGANVGIGKYWEQGALDVAGAIYADGLIDSASSITGTSLVSQGALTVAGQTYLNGSEIQGDSKTMLRYDDAYLRINPDNDFTSGIYAGTGILRTDGNFQVGPSGGTLNVSGSTFTYEGNAVGIPGLNGLPYRMAAGTVTTSTSATVQVNFTAGRFTTNIAPIVTVTSVGGANAVAAPYVASVTYQSFTLSLYATNAVRLAQVCHWHAIQMTSSSASN